MKRTYGPGRGARIILGIAAALLASACGGDGAESLEPQGLTMADLTSGRKFTTLEGASNAAQILIDEIAQDQIDAVDQLHDESKVSDPPNPQAQLIRALAAVALSAAFTGLAASAAESFVNGLVAAETRAANTLLFQLFAGMRGAVIGTISADVQARLSPGVNAMDAYFLGMHDSLQTAKTHQLLDFNLNEYAELAAIKDKTSQLRAANAVVSKLMLAWGGKHTGAAFQKQYRETLTQYCVLLAQSGKGTVDSFGKKATNLGEGGSERGILSIHVEIDNSAAGSGDYSAKMKVEGARIAGLNENLRGKLDTPHRSIGSLGLPIYIDGLYFPSPATPYSEPAALRIGKNEAGKVFLVQIEPFDAYASTQRDMMVWLAAQAGRKDTRDSKSLLRDAEDGAAAVFEQLKSLKLATPRG